jgi:dipeptidyl aminopeptidase/acylaminoacyl peptidase
VERKKREVAPHGSWTSPVTAELLVEQVVRLSDVAVDGTTREGGTVYWVEGRASEGGRQVVVSSTGGDVLPQGFSARTTVHEYGGAPFAVRDGTVWFSNFDDQRVYRIDPGGEPVAVTPGPTSRWTERYADLEVSPDGLRVAAVRERHPADGEGEAVNDVVVLTGDGCVDVVAAGHDFYAAPRFAPSGSLAWLSWDHPNMPWDGTELWLERAAAPAAGGPDESVSQPRWGPDGVLHWLSDASGWWSLYRNGRQLVAAEAELGGPDWVFGQATYTPLPGDLVVAAKVGPGLGELWLLDDGSPTSLPTPYTSFSSVRPFGDDAVVAIAASAGEAPAVVVITVRGPGKGEVEVLRRSREASVDAAYLSEPRAITFPTEGGLTAHALYYPPANGGFEGPPGELPPLVVMSHGGPTSAASSALNLSMQYFTSRGLAVVDVDYGGSTGYGREYRRRLDGQWGVVDVADCVNAARYLVDAGEVDGRRLAIRGGSAGGYTTLAALTFTDVFAAGASYYGVADLASLATDTHKFESRYLDRLVGRWPEAEATYRERSPIHAADRLSAPLIVFQGAEDKVVPPAQAEVMVGALRANGLPVAYLLFEDEQHGFRKAETITRTIEAELWFYGRILGFEPADAIEPVHIENLG